MKLRTAIAVMLGVSITAFAQTAGVPGELIGFAAEAPETFVQ